MRRPLILVPVLKRDRLELYRLFLPVPALDLINTRPGLSCSVLRKIVLPGDDSLFAISLVRKSFVKPATAGRDISEGVAKKINK